MAEPKTQIVPKGAQTKLEPNTFVHPNGQVLVSWNTSRDGSGEEYQDQSTVNIQEPLTLYAQWGHRVEWNPMGGTPVPQRLVKSGHEIGDLPTSQKEGFNLDGWYTRQTGGTKLTENEPIAQDRTFYAHWKGKSWEKLYPENSIIYYFGGTATQPTLPMNLFENKPQGNYQLTLENMEFHHRGIEEHKIFMLFVI